MDIELRKIYFANALAGLSNVASVVGTLYFLNNGISQTQIGQLAAVFMISMSIFNIPTGAFADIVGHKMSVVLGLFFHALNGLMFYMFPTFPGMVVGMLSAGLGLALQTGAWSSLTYELLKKNGKESMMAEVSGKAAAYFAAAAVIGSLVGGPIFKWSPKIPYLLFFICISLAGVVASQIKYRKPKIEPAWSSLRKFTLEGIRYTVTNRKLLGLMIITLAMTTGRMLLNQNIGQPYQVNIGLDVAFIGITAAFIQLIQMGVSAWTYKLANRIGYELSLVIAVTTPAIAVFFMSRISNLYSLSFLFLFYAAQAFKEPISVHLSQKLMIPTHRATMASTFSMISSVIVGLLLPIGGKSIDILGINQTLMILAVMTLVVGGTGLAIYQSSTNQG